MDWTSHTSSYIILPFKRIEWMGSSYHLLKSFSKSAKRKAGYELGRVQRGEEPSDWKLLNTVGHGVMEIRIHEPHEHRVICVAKFTEAVYVLHAFEKKTRKTSKHDLWIARTQYAQVQKKRTKG